MNNTKCLPGAFESRFPFRSLESYQNRQCPCATEPEACHGCKSKAELPEPVVGIRHGFERADLRRQNVHTMGGARLRDYLGSESERREFKAARKVIRDTIARSAAKGGVQ